MPYKKISVVCLHSEGTKQGIDIRMDSIKIVVHCENDTPFVRGEICSALSLYYIFDRERIL